jgi:F0F1-type ATP synthase membrane subunit b/b'
MTSPQMRMRKMRKMPATRARWQRKGIVPAAAILFFVAAAASSGVLQAQEQSASKPSQQEQEQKDKNEIDRRRGPAQSIVHESREAAGEEADETAVFKQSTSVRMIAKWTGLNLQYAYWLCVLINFAVIGGVILWAAKKYLPGAFRDRTAAIQKAMQEAQKASEEARRKLADIESRLAKLDTEIANMRASAEKEAAGEEARIQAAAEEDARKIVQSAEQEIAAAIKTARRELTAYAADLAVGLAQKQIHVDAATDQSLIQSFAGQLNAAPEAPGKGGR